MYMYVNIYNCKWMRKNKYTVNRYCNISFIHLVFLLPIMEIAGLERQKLGGIKSKV